MKIIPAIDLCQGQCVRLYQGQFDQMKVYRTDPISIAKHYAEQGIDLIHIVDLDGAKQQAIQQSELILQIQQQAAIKLQVGGGIRQHEDIRSLLNAGIERVVIGSLAVTQPELIKQWLNQFGADHIVLALDVRYDNGNMPYVLTKGWQQQTAIDLWTLLANYEDSSLRHILCTDVQRDGTLQGVNLKLYQQCLQRYPGLQLQASGGVSQLSDLTGLQALAIPGVIIGKALYENHFTIEQALATVQPC